MLSYQLTPVPYCIGSADGYLGKTDKSKGFHLLVNKVPDAKLPDPKTSLTVVDGNALFYSIRELPKTFGDVARKLLDMIPRDSDVIFSTDMYHETSVKSMERRRRGWGKKLIVQGPNTKRPQDWKGFLANDENKEGFIDLLLQVWSSDDTCAQKLHDRKVINSVGYLHVNNV